MTGRVVIIGSGQAGYQTAASLVERGWSGSITMIGQEGGLPYSRPPLSKEYLDGTVPRSSLGLRSADFFKEAIDLIIDEAVAIDRESRTVFLAEGGEVTYDILVLATGAQSRVLPIPGAQGPGCFTLRTASDADAIRASLDHAHEVIVIGAGFIGLEFAATARKRGCKVTVFEAASRAMGRAVSAEMAGRMVENHQRNGVEFRFGQTVKRVVRSGDAVLAVDTSTGQSQPADLILMAVGVAPSTSLAEDAGLEVDNGIVTDGALRTSDPAIYAVGDCASYPSVHTGQRVRLESVQNAVDHGKAVAASILEGDRPYRATPWFWSYQGSQRLQIAGLPFRATNAIVREEDERRHAVYLFDDDELVAVETLGLPAEHIAARKALEVGARIRADDVREVGFSLARTLKEGALT